jgi:hypothetical protein
MSGYVTKLKARREECYSLQAGEAPLAFSRRLGGGGGAPQRLRVPLSTIRRQAAPHPP